MFIDELDKKLRRIDFVDKMFFLQNQSLKKLTLFGEKNDSEVNNKTQEFYTFELALLAYRAVVASEGKVYKTMSDSRLELLKLVREQGYMQEIYSSTKDIIHAAYLLMNIQVPHQYSWYLNLYRYRFFLKELYKLEEVFDEKLLNLDDFEAFVIQLHIAFTLYSENNFFEDGFKLIAKIADKYKDILNFFTVNRMEFIEKAEKLSFKNKIYKAAELNHLRRYPFIFFNNTIFYPYIPFIMTLPETYYRVITSQEIFTSKIARKISAEKGKIFENYILKILYESEIYKDINIIEEFEFKDGRAIKKSHDIYLYKDGELISIEVKMDGVPFKAIEQDEDALNTLFERYAEHIIQCYEKKKIIADGGHLEKFMISDIKNHYGVALCFDEIYFKKADIYQRAARILESKGTVITPNEIASEVILVTAKDLEKNTFGKGCTLFELCKAIYQNNSMFDVVYDSILNKKTNVYNQPYNEFISLYEKHFEEVKNYVEHLK